MLKSVFAGILFLALGVFIFLKPELVWELTESWKSNYPDEPSDLYWFSTKFGGALLALFGIAVAILSIIVE